MKKKINYFYSRLNSKFLNLKIYPLPILIKYIIFNSNNNEDEYIKKIWVGLMDGDGSIQVNHWRLKYLQFRIIIKLKNCPQNLKMLDLISNKIGGFIKITEKNQNIIWIVNNKKTIKNIIKIFEKYPPLTHRLNAQLAFLIKCINHNNVDTYFKTRNLKYGPHWGQWGGPTSGLAPLPTGGGQLDFKFHQNLNPQYFNEWLSGFIEAKGCFIIRKNGYNSFSICQKDEYHLINKIKEYFEITSQISIRNEICILKTYKKSTFYNIIEHCETFPLLGNKLTSFNLFKNIELQ